MSEKMTLEPCPFCGASKITPVRVANVGHAVSCDGCGASSEVGPSIDSAVAKWNHRHLAQPAQAVDVPYDNALNDAGWAFTKAMPVSLPGPIFNNVKPALKAAIEKWMQMRAIGNAQAEGWTRAGTLNVQRWKGIDSMINTDFDYASDLPDGTYQLFTPTPSTRATPNAHE